MFIYLWENRSLVIFEKETKLVSFTSALNILLKLIDSDFSESYCNEAVLPFSFLTIVRLDFSCM